MSKRKEDSREKGAGTGRRDFLKLAGLGTLAGGAALATTGEKAEAAETGGKGAKGILCKKEANLDSFQHAVKYLVKGEPHKQVVFKVGGR